jgi:hypothetical protein
LIRKRVLTRNLDDMDVLTDPYLAIVRAAGLQAKAVLPQHDADPHRLDSTLDAVINQHPQAMLLNCVRIARSPPRSLRGQLACG